MRATITTASRWAALTAATATLAAAAACSPGTLPGTPSLIQVGGGGARYNGSVTYRRLGGNFAIVEGSQTFDLSLVVREANQITGRFESGTSSGTVQGQLRGDLASGTFEATLLLQTPATQVTGATICEGRGSVIANLAGRNLTWASGTITYDNCPGLAVSSQAQATAISPIPGDFGTRASVVITVVGGAEVPRSTCPDGRPGYPFTVEMTETVGIGVTFDPTFVVEERRNFGEVTSNSLDMPFTEIDGGERRSYSACSPVFGTYQAFFSGIDDGGNRVRVASPTVTFLP